MATYTVKNMRAIKPSAKMAEKHPDRFITIFGEFFTEKGVQMTITQKVISKDEAKDATTVIDLSNGILTLPDSQRGRKAFTSISQEDILADLEALRK